jgi:hypothetical protein
MAKRDKVELNVYGMEGVPQEVIEDKLARKVKKKKIALEKELKRLFKIDLDDPKFKLDDYEIEDPRPRKRHGNNKDIFRQVPLMPTLPQMMPPHGAPMMPPPGAPMMPP